MIFIDPVAKSIAPPPVLTMTALEAPASGYESKDLAAAVDGISRGVDMFEEYVQKIRSSRHIFMAETVENFIAGGIPQQPDWIIDAVKELQREHVRDLQQLADQLRKHGRNFRSDDMAQSIRLMQYAVRFSSLVKQVFAEWDAIITDASQLSKQFGPAQERQERIIAVYKRSLEHVLSDKGVRWTLQNFQNGTPSEAFPWFEIDVSPEMRANRPMLRQWERSINRAVEEVDPTLVGIIAINYRTVRFEAEV